MAKWYGIKCSVCEEIIQIDRCIDDPLDGSVVPVPALEPIPCKNCGSSCHYGSDDVKVFEI